VWSTKARRPSLSAYTDVVPCLATIFALNGILNGVGDICPLSSIPGDGI